MAELDIAQAATIGARAEQQDAAGIVQLGSDGAALLVLADGLGGHADGARAARLVIETFDNAARNGTFDQPDSHRQALDGIIEQVNQRIHAASDPSDGHRGMASTAVAAIVTGGTVRWISVGDSHLYVCRDGRLWKLNADHSQAGMMLREGHSPNDEAVINVRSVLVSALTGRAIEEIDSPAHDVSLEPGDVVILASDGLNTLSDAEIALTIGQHIERGANAIAAALVDKVLEKGVRRQDNATVIVARVPGDGAPASDGSLTPMEAAAHAAAPLPSSGRPASGDAAPSLDTAHQPHGLILKIFLALLVAAAIGSVIVTQTACCGWP